MQTITLSQINNILANALNQQTLLLKQKSLYPLIILLKKTSKNIQLKEKEIMNYNSIISNYMSQGMSRKSAITQGYIQGKISIDINQKEKQLLNSIVEGYQIVNQVRQKLTKEKISYQIGAGNKASETIMQDSLSFDQLVPYLYIESRAQGYSVRIRVSQTMLKDTFQKRHREIKNNVDEVIALTSEGSTLYSAVYRYFTYNKLDRGKATVGNWGNFYQAYRLLYNRSPRKNQYRPRETTIAKAFSQVLSGGGKSGSFATGGDVLFEQDKASFGSNPTLTSTQSVTSALNDLAKNLQIYINTSSIQPLTKMLVRQQAGTKVERKARDQAIQSIKQALSSIPGIDIK